MKTNYDRLIVFINKSEAHKELFIKKLDQRIKQDQQQNHKTTTR